MRDDDLSNPADAEDREFYAFVATYQEALAAGRSPPSVDSLRSDLRPRWEQMRALLHLLDRTRGTDALRTTLPSRIAEPVSPSNALKTQGEHCTPISAVGSGSPSERTQAAPLGRIGRYELLQELGRGGMGVVYLARDPELDRLVAVKRIQLGGAGEPKQWLRFQIEGQLLARQRHPNIVQVHEAGEANGQPFLAMEYVDGPTLQRRLGGQPLAPRAAAELVEVLAWAVEHAHGNGIVHRDLKPGNVLLTAAGTPKITDFGLATTLDQTLGLTRTGDLVGTPMYMAPEMATACGNASGAAVDVYGLGTILYETLTGHPPFLGGNPVFVLAQVQHVDPVAPRQWSAVVPADLETICLKCLHKEAGRRYGSAAALADDLRRYLNGLPIEARPAGGLERTLKWARRHPARATAWGSVAAALLIIWSLVFVYNVRLTQERNHAFEQETAAEQSRAAENQARRDAESRLIDLSTSLGLTAEAGNNLPLAALWFAVAVRQSGSDPQREQANRLRWLSYTAANPVPWRVVQLPGGQHPRALSLHPDGGWLLTADSTGCRLWDLRREQQVPLPAAPGRVTAAAWSLDGRFLVTGTDQGAVQRLSFPQGELAGQTEIPEPVTCLCSDAAGRKLAVAGGNQVHIWDPETSQLVAPELSHPDRILGLAFSPAATRIATVCRDRMARVFALDGAEQPPILLGPVPHRLSEEASPWDELPGFLGENELVTSTGAEIVVWDVAGGTAVERIPGGPYRVSSANVSPDGRSFLVRHHMQEPSLWQTDPRRRVEPSTRLLPAETATFSADAKRLLLAGRGGFQLWNVNGTPASSVLWHPGNSWPIACSADGRWLATTGKQGLVRIWHSGAAAPLRARLPLTDYVNHAVFFVLSPDGSHVLAADTKAGRLALQVHDVADGKATGSAVELPPSPLAGAFSPDGRTTYVVTQEGERGQLHAWRWQSGQAVFPAVSLAYRPLSLACSPDGRTLAIVGVGGEIELREAASGQLRSTRRHGARAWDPVYPAERIRFAPDGRTFVTFGCDNKVCQWNTRDGSPVRALTHLQAGWCADARYSPDSRFLVSANMYGHEVRVWDLATGQAASPPLTHPDRVFTARFDPAGDRVVTACRDGKVRVWEWRSGRESISTLNGDDEVTDAAFSPDGRWIASTEAGGTARLWDARTGSPLTPAWPLGSGQHPLYYVNRLEFSRDGRSLLVAVRARHLCIFDLTLLTGPPAPELSAEDLVLLAEINAGATVQPSGNVDRLTSEDWLARWQTWRREHPEVIR